jgi:hypothetical protein
MSQLSLFFEPNYNPELWYKVRLTNIYTRSLEDRIYTYKTEKEAYEKLDSWVKLGNGNSGRIYQERVTRAFLQDYHPLA